MLRLTGFVALAVLGAVVAPENARAGSYRDYAAAILAQPPAGVVLRPELAADLARSTNAYRASRRVAAAQPSDDFAEAAQAQAMDMAAHDYVGHMSSTGHDFEVRMRAFLGNPLLLPPMAEIAARDSKSEGGDGARIGRITGQWVHSQTHRKAMINAGYHFVSTAVAEKNGKLYAVQVYFSPAPAGNSGLFAPPGAAPAQLAPAKQKPATGGGLY